MRHTSCGAFEMRPAEFWGGAACAPLSCGVVYVGVGASLGIIWGLDFPYFSVGVFLRPVFVAGFFLGGGEVFRGMVPLIIVSNTSIFGDIEHP